MSCGVDRAINDVHPGRIFGPPTLAALWIGVLLGVGAFGCDDAGGADPADAADLADTADLADSGAGGGGQSDSATGPVGGSDSGAPGPDAGAVDTGVPRPSTGRVSVSGTALRGGDGERVILRGVNLGGWLFHETWITGVGHTELSRLRALAAAAGATEEVDAALRAVGSGSGESWRDDVEAELAAALGPETARTLIAGVEALPSVGDDSDLPLRLVLEDRFGLEGRDALLDTFHGAWIREADIAAITELGFNLVRIPIGYRSLVHNSDRAAPAELDWNEAAFGHLDRLLALCQQYGISAVVDIQEAPGGANDYSGPARLYDEPAMQALTIDLWTTLADRYRGHPSVAAYSLLAEPFGAPSAEARDVMYDRLVQAIRETGDDTPLVIHDGFDGMESLPDPATYGWAGVIYSTHLFEWGAPNLAAYRALTALYGSSWAPAQARQAVPYFVGSFSTFRDEAWAYESARYLVDWYEENEWSWSVWTWKRLDDVDERAVFGDAASTGWGVLGRLEDGYTFERPDVYEDDLETLTRKMAAYAELPLQPNPKLVEAIAPARR